MKKEMSIAILIMLIGTVFFTTFSVIAGDEDNPEIIDNSNDTMMKHYDIISAWFSEIEEDPDYLVISLKVNSLKTLWMGGTYLVEWTSTSGRFASGSMIGLGLMKNSWRCGDYSKGDYTKYDELTLCEGSFDKIESIITWKIPKIEIGNPTPGDILMNTKAISCITGRFLMLLPLRGLPQFHDIAPDENYGFDYKIKY
jgi:hypothetical protein